MKSEISFFTILVSLVLSFASQAQAGLLGSNVNTQYYAYGSTYNFFGSPASFVANGNFVLPSSFLSLNFQSPIHAASLCNARKTDAETSISINILSG